MELQNPTQLPKVVFVSTILNFILRTSRNILRPALCGLNHINLRCYPTILLKIIQKEKIKLVATFVAVKNKYSFGLFIDIGTLGFLIRVDKINS